MKSWRQFLDNKTKKIKEQLKEEAKDHQEVVCRIEGQEDQVDLEAHHQEAEDQAVQVVQADHHQAEDHHQAILNTEDHHQVVKVAHHQDIHSTEAHHQAVQEVHKVNQTLLAEDENYNNEYK